VTSVEQTTSRYRSDGRPDQIRLADSRACWVPAPRCNTTPYTGHAALHAPEAPRSIAAVAQQHSFAAGPRQPRGPVGQAQLWSL